MNCTWKARWFNCPALLLLGLFVVSASGQEASSLRAAADARALAEALLPPASAIGPGWLQPWEIPVEARWLARETVGADNEDSYWIAAAERMGPAGMSESEARELATRMVLRKPAGEGEKDLPPEEAIITALDRMRALNEPVAQRLPRMWQAARERLTAAAQALRDGVGTPGDKQSGAVADALARLAAANYRDMSATELIDTFVRAATLMRRRSEMTYLRSGNWPALARASDSGSLDANADFCVVSVRLLVANATRLNEFPDLSANQAPALQARLQRLLTEAGGAGDALRSLQVASEPPGVTSTLGPGALRVTVTPLTHGENSYVVRFAAAGGGSAGDFSGAWMRHGETMVEVNVTGHLSPAETSALIESLFSHLETALGGRGQPLPHVAGQPLPPVAAQTGADGTAQSPSGTQAPLPADLVALAATVGKAQVSDETSQAANQLGDKGTALIVQGKLAEATAVFLQAVHLNPNDVLTWMDLGAAYIEGRQWAEAEAVLRVAVKVAPRLPFVHAALAEALLRQGRREEALKEATEAKRFGDKNSAILDELGLK
jgi:tetratricopeptide (TPR) repeat protein